MAEPALVALRNGVCELIRAGVEPDSRRRDDEREGSSTRPHALEVTSDDTMSTNASSELSSSLLERIRGLDAEDASAEHRQLAITQLAQTLARDARDLRRDRKAVAVSAKQMRRTRDCARN